MIEPKTPAYDRAYDLTNCDAEPVHFIRHYQLPAFLLVVDPQELTVKACSSNFSRASAKGGYVIGQKLGDLIGQAQEKAIAECLEKEDYPARNPLSYKYVNEEGEAQNMNLILSPSGTNILLEFEPRDAELSESTFLYRIDQALHKIQNSVLADNLFDKVVQEVKDLTGYDRVMLYRFDAEYNGEVVAECKNEDLEPFLHLRYPHTDIPKQSRDLFLKNAVRHIVNTNPLSVSAVMSDPDAGEVDLTFSLNRGASPIHLQYLNNMGVGATLTVALVVDQKLWGLISCHHASPKLLDYRLRSIISLVGKVLAGHLSLQNMANYRHQVLGASINRSRLFERMSEKYDVVDGLLRAESPTLLDLTSSSGAVVLRDGEVHQMGNTPSEAEIREIVAFLDKDPSSLYSSDEFFKELPAASSFDHSPAGLLSIRITRDPSDYIMWFRPEIIKTVMWGGRPDQRKHVLNDKVELHPQLSFRKWEQQMGGSSQSWQAHEIDAASGLRSDIKELILQKYQKVRRLNGQLVDAYQELETFSYTVSHDLRAPLRNIKSFAEILQEDYKEQLDDFGRQALGTIINSVGKMNTFINDLLEYARFSRSQITLLEVDMDLVIEEVWNDLRYYQRAGAKFHRKGGGVVLQGDFLQLKQLVQNILSNAFKYSSKVAQPEVWLNLSVENGNAVLEIKDNGIGFNMKHAERIFTVFNRLVSEDDYEGSGIGLAIAQRIVEKHQGTISVFSEPGSGTTFTITIPTEITDTVNSLVKA